MSRVCPLHGKCHDDQSDVSYLRFKAEISLVSLELGNSKWDADIRTDVVAVDTELQCIVCFKQAVFSYKCSS
jgi:hypothetical protein